MLPQSQVRKKKNSSKVNLVISIVFHTLIVVFGVYFAARNGLLGHQLKKIAVEMVKTEKPPEKPPVKPKEEPKVEQAKVEPPKMEQPKMEEAKAPPPPDTSAPTVAPAATELPSFDFEGGKTVVSESDPVQIYKSYVEYSFKSRWDRPEDMDDDNYVAEVAVDVDRAGQISNPVWQKSSGNKRWDDSVRKVFDEVTSMDHRPPTNFPSHVTIRFDVQQEAAIFSQ